MQMTKICNTWMMQIQSIYVVFEAFHCNAPFKICCVFPSVFTCRQMARLTLQPKAVLTDRGWRPRSLKSLEKECVSDILGLSSATTTQARTRDRSRPRAWTGKKDLITQRTEGLLRICLGVFIMRLTIRNNCHRYVCFFLSSFFFCSSPLHPSFFI